MAGLIFLKTRKLDEISNFYIEKIGAKKWISQPDIEILRHDNLLFGFHQQNESDLGVLLTFFFETKEEVNSMYQVLKGVTTSEPKENSKYKIYNFFAKDPEGRNIEFQTFLHKLPPY